MLEKLEEALKKYENVEKKLADPSVAANLTEYKSLMRERKALAPLAEKYLEYKEAKKSMDDAGELMSDPEMRDLAQEEYYDAKHRCEALEDEIRTLLLPRDPNDERNVIIEIRGGAGGEEAALFASSLYRMYTMYAVSAGFKYELIGFNETGLGGYKEISFMIKGDGAYSRFKFESDIHLR